MLPESSPESLLELINDPDALQSQMLADSLLALDTIRIELKEKQTLGTQKFASFVALSKLTCKLLEDQKKQNPKPNVITDLLCSLPFHEDGVDTVVTLPSIAADSKNILAQ